MNRQDCSSDPSLARQGSAPDLLRSCHIPMLLTELRFYAIFWTDIACRAQGVHLIYLFSSTRNDSEPWTRDSSDVLLDDFSSDSTSWSPSGLSERRYCLRRRDLRGCWRFVSLQVVEIGSYTTVVPIIEEIGRTPCFNLLGVNPVGPPESWSRRTLLSARFLGRYIYRV
ncbi:hypothetical protein BV25DRAFT_856670 [Artomyces pyxidatus]|uniref:Uncharacterized protein n=1 Tax=Artomyces pyxidatus TaxID=48021 RepID=A0ACB8TH34_9AGAM|nr:hypothetical protein BV25DRAFT_856670 [Artomyces pyxidatus]